MILPPIDVEPDEVKVAEVVQLRPLHTTEQTLTVKHGGDTCFHSGKIVDENKRTVTCGRCKTVLDAFEVLYRIAVDHDHVAFNRAQMVKDTEAARKRYDLLRRLETNARNRLKRVASKLGDEVPSAYEMDVYLDGKVCAWARHGRVELRTGNKSLTPDEARAVAKQLEKLAREAERGEA